MRSGQGHVGLSHPKPRLKAMATDIREVIPQEEAGRLGIWNGIAAFGLALLALPSLSVIAMFAGKMRTSEFVVQAVTPDPTPTVQPVEILDFFPLNEQRDNIQADWRISETQLLREWRTISGYWVSFDGGTGWSQPVLKYFVEIENIGDPVSAQEEMIARSMTTMLYPGEEILATGTEGVIPYAQISFGSLVCGPTVLLASIPIGLYGDQNGQNNWGLASADGVTLFNRDLSHSSPPEIMTRDGYTWRGIFRRPGDVSFPHQNEPWFQDDFASTPQLRVYPWGIASGMCPPLLWSGSGDPADAEMFHLWIKLYINNEFISSRGPLPPLYAPSISIPDYLNNHDVICMEVSLDPPATGLPYGFIAETDETNNVAVHVIEYRTNIWVGDRFITAYFDNSGGATCESIEAIETGGASVIVVTSALSGMAVLGLLGILLVRFVKPRFRWGGPIPTLVVGITGMVLGGFVGFQIGDAIRPTPLIATKVDDLAEIRETSEIVGCDRYLNPDTASPSNLTVFEHDPEELILSLQENPNLPDPVPDRYLIHITSNSGREAFVGAWAGGSGVHTYPASYYIGSLDLQTVLHATGSDLLNQEGVYEWYVALGEQSKAGDFGDTITLCQGSTVHNFVIGKIEDQLYEPAEEIDAPEEPEVIVSPTPPDTAAPVVSAMNAVPNPTLTTVPVTVSARITDETGIAGADLYYQVGKGAVQYGGAMHHTGGGVYSIQIGPLVPAGTYTYYILAADSLGNATCTVGTIEACPGGSFDVNIP